MAVLLAGVVIRKVGTLDEVARRLYARPPEEFTKARDEAARAARASGDQALAGEIGKLRRPTQAAWLANLLALRRADDVAAWLALGEEMRDAHHQLSGARLRDLSARRTELVDELVAAARELAADTGRHPAEGTMAELRATLRAALADPDVADALRAGRVRRAATYSGLGFAASGEPAAEATATEPSTIGQERPRLRLVGPKAATATGQLDRARATVTAAEQAVEAAAAAEAEARGAYDEFGSRLAELREEISELEEHRAEADRARRRHSRDRERAERELARARRRFERAETSE